MVGLICSVQGAILNVTEKIGNFQNYDKKIFHIRMDEITEDVFLAK